MPPAVISKHSERVRKREERRRDREAATARQAAADAELREQQEAEDFKLLDALLTACNGNYSRTAALADPRPVRRWQRQRQSSAGFWPGGGGPAADAAFYSYAYPAPEGFASAAVRPARAFFSKDLGEFILPYNAVRTAPDPEGTLMEFLRSTYEAAADLGRWDRAALECALGEVGRPWPAYAR